MCYGVTAIPADSGDTPSIAVELYEAAQ